MPTFPGSLRLAADPESRVRADIEVDAERLVVRAGGDELGNWELSSLTFDPAPGGFRMRADGEDLILTTGDNPKFADLVGIAAPPEPSKNGQEEPVAASEVATKTAPRPGADSKRFGRLRSRSAASWVDDDTLHPVLAYIVMAAGILTVTGAALNWGDVRLLGADGLPWARIFAATAGIGAIVGAYLAWREQKRMMGAGIAVGAGVIALVLLYLYGAEAGLGIGYFLAWLAVVPLIGAAVVGLTKLGIAPMPDRH